jgi:hypothetical protein
MLAFLTSNWFSKDYETLQQPAQSVVASGASYASLQQSDPRGGQTQP